MAYDPTHSPMKLIPWGSVATKKETGREIDTGNKDIPKRVSPSTSTEDGNILTSTNNTTTKTGNDKSTIANNDNNDDNKNNYNKNNYDSSNSNIDDNKSTIKTRPTIQEQ